MMFEVERKLPKILVAIIWILKHSIYIVLANLIPSASFRLLWAALEVHFGSRQFSRILPRESVFL